MNVSDYKKDTRFIWGLHVETLQYIFDYINNNKNDIKRILEFGSGLSTKFLMDVRKELSLNYVVTSFDHLPQFSFNEKLDGLQLNIRNLIEYDDKTYDMMFENFVISKNYRISTNIFDTRAKNTTYEIHTDDITGIYDIIIIDGPNGNGRNISYLYFMNNIRKDTFLVIDDYYHYDFLDKCSKIFNIKILEIKKFVGGNKGHAMILLKNKKI